MQFPTPRPGEEWIACSGFGLISALSSFFALFLWHSPAQTSPNFQPPPNAGNSWTTLPAASRDCCTVIKGSTSPMSRNHVTSVPTKQSPSVVLALFFLILASLNLDLVMLHVSNVSAHRDVAGSMVMANGERCTVPRASGIFFFFGRRQSCKCNVARTKCIRCASTAIHCVRRLRERKKIDCFCTGLGP